MTDIAGESLIFRRGGFTPPLSLLMPTFAFPAAPGTLAGTIQRWRQCSPTGRASRAAPRLRLRVSCPSIIHAPRLDQ